MHSTRTRQAARLAVAAVGLTALAATSTPAVAATPAGAVPAAAPAAVPAAAPVADRDASVKGALRATAGTEKGERAAARSSVSAPRASATSIGSSLPRGQVLDPGEALVSPSGRWSLVMDPSGELQLVKAPNQFAANPYVQTLAFGDPGSRYAFQTDGNVVLYGPDNTVFAAEGTGGPGPQSLVVQDDGNIVIYGPGFAYSYDTYAPPYLGAGGTLLPGEFLESGDGTRLVLQTDGNLVLYAPGGARFSTGTTAGRGFVLQDDGNAVLYSGTGQPLFATGSSSGPDEFFELGVFDREFAVTAYSGDVSAFSLYSSEWTRAVVEPGMALLPGDRRTAAGGGAVLRYQTDGNLVNYRGGTPTFASRTSGAGFALMQPDGNFVVYVYVSGEGDVVPGFNTRTATPGSRLVTQSDGNVVVYTPANRPVFSAR